MRASHVNHYSYETEKVSSTDDSHGQGLVRQMSGRTQVKFVASKETQRAGIELARGAGDDALRPKVQLLSPSLVS